MSDRAALVAPRRLGRHRDPLHRCAGSNPRGLGRELSALIAAFGLPSDPALAEQRLAERERAAPLGLGPVHLAPCRRAAARARAAASRASARDRLDLPPRRRRGAAPAGWRSAGEHGDKRIALPLPPGLPLGYHRLALEAGGIGGAIEPDRRPRPLPSAAAARRRRAQLGSDLPALWPAQRRTIGEWAISPISRRSPAPLEPAAPPSLGVNPLHALFAAEPLHFSPYSPSSRTWLNHLYIDADGGAGLCRRRDGAGVDPGRVVRRHAMGGALGRS